MDGNDQNNSIISRSQEAELLANEAKAVASFLKIVNNDIRVNGSVNPMSERTALKFLIARKFDIHRALHLYQMHEITRLREGLSTIDANESDLKVELNSGKFTIFKHRDANNSAIAVFTGKLHAPNKSTKNQASKKVIHRTTLQGIVYQLDSALEDISTQRNGIVFVYNMSDSDYTNFDYELCQKILNLLKGAYPAKLKKVLIVSPPLWFKAPFLVLSLIVREKLRDRVWLLSIDRLLEHIPQNSLTPDFGGTYQHNHQAWIEECNILYKTSYNDLCDPTSAQTLAKSFSQKSSINFKPSSSSQDSLSALEGYDVGTCSQNKDAGRPKEGVKQSSTFTYDYDETGYSLIQLIAKMKSKGMKGLADEYDEVAKKEIGTFLASTSTLNMNKNRYINIKCYDHTRVVLDSHDLADGSSLYDPEDYINASYVDGYRQPRAYISTQGPIEKGLPHHKPTIDDFWRMMWQTGSRVIVMVTLIIEHDTMKCSKYWPSFDNPVLEAGLYTVEYKNIEVHDDFVMTHLILTNKRSGVSRDIWHLQFISWPDFGTPLTASALLKFRESVLKKQLDAIEATGGSTYPPIVVHCSAGVGRSGTFITVDICIQKLETTGLVDVKKVVEKLREQRYLSIQTKDQYIFCYKSVIEYAASCGLLHEEDLQGLLDS